MGQYLSIKVSRETTSGGSGPQRDVTEAERIAVLEESGSRQRLGEDVGDVVVCEDVDNVDVFECNALADKFVDYVEVFGSAVVDGVF